MSSHNDDVRGRELAMTWELDLDYVTIARYADLVVVHARRPPRRGRRRFGLAPADPRGHGRAAYPDARPRTGQGLSRLLNVVDGLIGQGLRVVVLVTTNEPLRTIHPAVSRPGRCAAQVEFTVFPPTEADAWLERHGRVGDGSAQSLASLFGHGEGLERPEKRPLGFSAN